MLFLNEITHIKRCCFETIQIQQIHIMQSSHTSMGAGMVMLQWTDILSNIDYIAIVLSSYEAPTSWVSVFGFR